MEVSSYCDTVIAAGGNVLYSDINSIKKTDGFGCIFMHMYAVQWVGVHGMFFSR